MNLELKVLMPLKLYVKPMTPLMKKLRYITVPEHEQVVRYITVPENSYFNVKDNVAVGETRDSVVGSQ